MSLPKSKDSLDASFENPGKIWKQHTGEFYDFQNLIVSMGTKNCNSRKFLYTKPRNSN